MAAYVKYHTFHQETKPRHKPNPFGVEQMPYDEAQDAFTCPNGKLLRYKATQQGTLYANNAPSMSRPFSDASNKIGAFAGSF